MDTCKKTSTWVSAVALLGVIFLTGVIFVNTAEALQQEMEDGGGGGGGGGGIPKQCDDGDDNDGNGLTDYPGDPGCSSLVDNLESGYTPPPATQCTDNIDNDSNSLKDYPADPGCTSAADTSESGYVVTQCNDNIDNDSNGLKDYPADLGCTSAADTTESGYTPPQCANTIDDDGDGNIDTVDYGCTNSSDTTEAPNPECADGTDNDANTVTDFPSDAGCSSYTDAYEAGYLPSGSGAGVLVHDGGTSKLYGVVRPDAYANGGIPVSDGSGVYHGTGSSPSPQGQRACYLVDPTAFPSGWSTRSYNSCGDNRVLRWNGTTWTRHGSCSYNNKYDQFRCTSYSPPDTALSASATSTTAGSPVTLTWNSQYGQVRQGAFAALNFSFSTTTVGQYQTITRLVCEPGCADDYGCQLVKEEKRNLLALPDGGSCYYETETVWVPGQTTSRPYSGSIVVSPTTTTTYRYTGSNVNGSTYAEVTVTVTALTQCNDGIDNDGNGQIDLADPGCTDPTDPTEPTECSDGLNNDGDAWTDLADPGCTGTTDTTETPNPECSDGGDNDGGGDTDYPADPGCTGITDTTESPNPPVIPTADLSASPTSVHSGSASTLSWTSTNSTSCTGTGFSTGGATSGSVSTGALTNPPQPSYGYQLSCTGPGGSANDTATVSITNPTADVSVSPDRVTPGGSVNVSWTSSQVSACSVSGTNGFSSSGLTGTNVSSGPITTQTTFTITCDGAAATDYVIVNVTVNTEEF